MVAQKHHQEGGKEAPQVDAQEVARWMVYCRMWDREAEAITARNVANRIYGVPRGRWARLRRRDG